MVHHNNEKAGKNLTNKNKTCEIKEKAEESDEVNINSRSPIVN